MNGSGVDNESLYAFYMDPVNPNPVLNLLALQFQGTAAVGRASIVHAVGQAWFDRLVASGYLQPAPWDGWFYFRRGG
jgi:hypothetical protein